MHNTNWPIAIQPLLRLYKNKNHPLDYRNNYQLLVMVLLAARDADKHVNQVAQSFFIKYPTMQQLAKARTASIAAAIKGVTNYHNKAQWLSAISQQIKEDVAIPLSLDALTALPGIGRKSANVILREAGAKPEGIMIDLHTARVAQRLGICTKSKATDMEAELMNSLPRRQWDAGMAMSFLGRDICRPRPLCNACLMRPNCNYYNEVIKPLP